MNLFLWIVQIFLALVFLFTGSSKLLMPAEEIERNMPSFLSLGFIYFIAVCEILGAVGLILPWLTRIKPGLTPLAAACLTVILVGATFITAMGNIPQAIIPAFVGVLCIVVAWGRTRSLTEIRK